MRQAAADRAGDDAGLAAFRDLADPARYVPRPATEAALAALRPVAAGDAPPAGLLVGPPGLGKTLVLRLLEADPGRAGRRVYLPYASLALDELCAWLLGLLGAPPAADPVEVLQWRTRPGAPGGPLVALIDEANSMPLPTARALGEIVAAQRGGLRLVLAAPDDARTSRVAAALGVPLVEHRLRAPMTEDETRRFLAARLRGAPVDPDTFEALTDGLAPRLHALSGGRPRRLLWLAGEAARGDAGEAVLRRMEPAWAVGPPGAPPERIDAAFEGVEAGPDEPEREGPEAALDGAALEDVGTAPAEPAREGLEAAREEGGPGPDEAHEVAGEAPETAARREPPVPGFADAEDAPAPRPSTPSPPPPRTPPAEAIDSDPDGRAAAPDPPGSAPRSAIPEARVRRRRRMRQRRQGRA